jgi:hypothetical protein
MTSILKVDTIQDADGNNIINESGNTITIGASGDTTNIIGTLQNDGAAVGGTNTPAFFVGQASSQTISDQTMTEVTLSSEYFDTASAFASNRFTVPSGQAGKYFLFGAVTGDGSDNYDRQHLQIRVNGSGVTQGNSNNRYTNVNVPSGGGYVTSQVSQIYDLSVGDYVSLYFYQDSGGNVGTYQERCWFMGYKIIE